jgi:hypothetical protein
VLLVAALLCAHLGMAWLALAMDVHWKQAGGAGEPSRRRVSVLRALGVAGLAASLALCLVADTATMAVLVWMMLLAVSAVTIAFLLAVKPGLLAPLKWPGHVSARAGRAR